jgi:hypothetical protein
VTPLVNAMRDSGVPIEIVDVQASVSDRLHDRKLILVRTDQHVAWRGDALPDRPDRLVATLTGRASAN